jgi:hypothetical protein
MTKLFAALVLSLCGLTVAVAATPFFRSSQEGWDHGISQPVAAPEIDPSSALTALTMLLGGVTVLRSRIAKK